MKTKAWMAVFQIVIMVLQAVQEVFGENDEKVEDDAK